MNPVRVSYIRDKVVSEFRSFSLSTLPPARPFTSLSFLDVGCGGGLLSESLARLGASTLGIDASLPNIRIARTHAAIDPALSSLSYRHMTAEQLLSPPAASASSSRPPLPSSFDVVCALEVVEHVDSPDAFTATLCRLVRPGGLLFMSTLNRTALSYVLAIVGAEYVMGWVSKGTHDWAKFVTPDELRHWVRQAAGLRMETLDVSGMLYDPLSGRWSLDKNRTEVNYILCARRPLL